MIDNIMGIILIFFLVSAVMDNKWTGLFLCSFIIWTAVDGFDHVSKQMQEWFLILVRR